jgi:anti-sigma28 factor (negative regulator of flagellin synthesis)
MILHLDSSVARSGDPNPVGSSGMSLRPGGSNSAGGQDTIKISGASSALTRMASERAARIQQLTSAVQNGAYQVSGATVAKAMVANSLAGES